MFGRFCLLFNSRILKKIFNERKQKYMGKFWRHFESPRFPFFMATVLRTLGVFSLSRREININYFVFEFCTSPKMVTWIAHSEL